MSETLCKAEDMVPSMVLSMDHSMDPDQNPDHDQIIPEAPISDVVLSCGAAAPPVTKKVLCPDCGARVRASNMLSHQQVTCKGGSIEFSANSPTSGELTEQNENSLQTVMLPDGTLDTKGFQLRGASETEKKIKQETYIDMDGLPKAGTGPEDAIYLDSDIEESSVGKVACQELERVFEEVDISERTIDALKKQGITTVTKLLENEDKLKVSALMGVKPHTQRKLHNFCLLYRAFYTEHEPHVSWAGRFDDDEGFFDAFEQEVQGTDSMSVSSDLTIRVLFEHAINMLHEDSMGTLNCLPDNQYQHLCEYAVQKVCNNIPDKLRESCHFPIKSFVFRIVKAIFNLPSGKPSGKTFLVNGRTQSGKTAFNALMVVISETLDCLLFSTTYGVPEAEELERKIRFYLCDSDTKKGPFKHFGAATGEPLVIAGTHSRVEKMVEDIKKLRKKKKNGRFFVVFDEADAFLRTPDSKQRTEKAFKQLDRLGPCIRIFLSATSVPCVLHCLETRADTHILQLGSADDYCGIDEMKPLRDSKGNWVFLDFNKISQKEGVAYSHVKELYTTTNDSKPLFPTDKGGLDTDAKQRFPTCEDLTFIPYTTESVMDLFTVALSGDYTQKKGVLILDCTAIRVNVGYTVFHKAACIQNYFYLRGKSLVVVVVVGSEIHFRRPGYTEGRFVRSKKKGIQDVLEKLDVEFGLSVPFAVFGYHKMRRSISYRPSRSTRVPTHMILKLGKGQSNENVVQALGRASGNFKSALKENGHSHVTVLTDKDDFIMATKYEELVPTVHARQQQGQTLSEAFDGTKRKLSDRANFLRHSKRKVGQRKDFRSMCPSQDKFEEAVEIDFDSDCTGINHQGMLRSIRELTRAGHVSFTVKDIERKFNDCCKDDVAIGMHQLTKVLRDLRSRNVLEWESSDGTGLRRYAVKDTTLLGTLIDQELDAYFG